MASGNINLKHPTFTVIKSCPVGFSFTTLFFGGFPALFRGDIKWGAIQILLQMLTLGLSAVVFSFMYNKLYIGSLLDEGYTSDDSENILSMHEGAIGRKIPRTGAA